MRRKPYLSLLLALAILGGILALFPTLWMLLVIALIGLVTLQVIVVRRNLFRVPAAHSQVPTPQGSTRPGVPRSAAAVASELVAAAADQANSVQAGAGPSGPAASAAPGAAAALAPEPARPGESDATPAATAPAEPARANLDADLFSRFRKHLEQAEAEASGTAAPREMPPPDEAEVQDRVVLSGAARRPASTGRPPAAPRPPNSAAPAAPAEEEGSDLFADLRPAPLPTPPTPPKSEPSASSAPAASPALDMANTVDMAAPPADSPMAHEPRATGRQEGIVPSRHPPADAPAEAAPGQPSAATDPTEETDADAHQLRDEGAALLNLAEESAARSDWDGLRASLDNYVAHLAEAPQLIHWRARLLQARLAVHEGDANRALQGFEEMLAARYRPTVDDVPAMLNGLLEGMEREAAAALRVSVLVRILAVFRQARDQRAMDRCYGWIEEAQEQVGDEQRLLQYLKNHLEIRKMLGDVPGQLELIDQLGNRCYRLGLTDEAKVYYEMGLRVRAEAEQAGAPQPGPSAAQEG